MKVTILWLCGIQQVLSAMMPVATPAPAAESEPNLPDRDMEDLLHFAITHSNLTKLREMAEAKHRFNASSFDELMEAMRHTDLVFEQMVNSTLIAKDWKTEAEFIGGFQFIEDYGDHLLDKADLIHKLGGLGPLIDLMLNYRVSDVLLVRVNGLVVELTQNRDTGKEVFFSLRPSVVKDVYAVMETDWQCFTPSANDQVCSSFSSVLNSFIGGNTTLQSELEESVFDPLAKRLTTVNGTSTLFIRLISTFRILATETDTATRWMHAMDYPSLLNQVGRIGMFTGEKIIGLVARVNRVLNRGDVPDLIVGASHRLYRQCIDVRGTDDDLCANWKIDMTVDHSDEL